VCPKCHGAGYLRYDVHVDDPRFGTLLECECTRAELEEKRWKLLLERSQLTELQHYTFDRWKVKFTQGEPPLGHPDKAYGVARRYALDPASEWEPTASGHPWLVLKGPTGTGKTHLAAAIGNARLAMRQPVIFMEVSVLLDHLRATFSPSSEITYDELFESLRNTPLLILDELGAEATTPWVKEKLFQLINHRYNRRLPLVVTTNMEATDIDPRLWSRMTDHQLSTVLELKAIDWRNNMQQQQPKPAYTRRPKPRVREEYQT
jgi:DNA replication protein DnaC